MTGILFREKGGVNATNSNDIIEETKDVFPSFYCVSKIFI